MEIFLLFEIQMVTKIGEEEKDTAEVPDPPLLRYDSRVMKPLAGEKGSDYHLDLR